MSVANEEFPLVCRVLKLIEVESYEVVEKVSLNLATKYIKLRPKNVQRVAISSHWSRTRRDRARPLPRSYEYD